MPNVKNSGFKVAPPETSVVQKKDAPVQLAPSVFVETSAAPNHIDGLATAPFADLPIANHTI